MEPRVVCCCERRAPGGKGTVVSAGARPATGWHAGHGSLLAMHAAWHVQRTHRERTMRGWQ